MSPNLFAFDADELKDKIPVGIGDFLLNAFYSFFYWLQVVSLFLALFLLIGIVYSVVRINQIRRAEKLVMEEAAGGAVDQPGVAVPDPLRTNPRWEHVKLLMESESENDWRLAILEADIMLADMVERMQYPGETLGEKLKGIERSDFNTIDNAWEAHKVRNKIAHEGSDMQLTQREAKRVIGLYESVFEEFHYI